MSETKDGLKEAIGEGRVPDTEAIESIMSAETGTSSENSASEPAVSAVDENPAEISMTSDNPWGAANPFVAAENGVAAASLDGAAGPVPQENAESSEAAGKAPQEGTASVPPQDSAAVPVPQENAEPSEAAGEAPQEGTAGVPPQDGAAGPVPQENEEPAEAAGEAPVMNGAGADLPKRRGWFGRFFLSCLSFLIVCGLIHVVYFVLKLEPFGPGTVSIDDGKIQYIDFFTYYVDVLRGVRPLSYDMGNMLGGSSFGLFSYYLASPFNLLLYFFGKEGVYRFFNVAVALKLGTAGATFCWYLQRRFEDRIRPALLIALSMGYGLMQYSVAQSSNIMWLDGVYMLPLMLLGVYEVIHRKSVWRLVLATAFCVCCNWYIAGINCLFSGFWFLFEFFFCERKEEKREVIVEREYPLRSGHVREEAPGILVGITDFIVSSCRYFWGMGLGIALSAGIFLPAVSAMRQGKGQYKEIEVLMEFSGDLLSFVRSYYIGAVSKDGMVALFCGGIAVFAAAALFFSGSFKFRQKFAFACIMGVCFLMLFWEPGILAFSLFKRVDSYWCRYSHLVCFAILFGAGAYISRAEKDRWSKIFVILSALLYGAALFKLNGIHFADLRAQGLSIVALNPAVFATAAVSVILSILTVILLSVKKKMAVRFLAGLLVLLISGVELGANAWLFWRDHKDDSQTIYLEYSEGLQAQLKQLRKLDDGYYRIAQDRTRWHYSADDLTCYFNDSLAQNYWSNTAYTSSPENTQLSLMWRLGYRDEAGCMLIVRDPILASDSFLGVKYLLESTPIRGLERVEEVDSFNGRSVYRNPYALPMAFVYDGSKLPVRNYSNAYVYQNALFSTLSGKKTELYTQLAWTRRHEGDKAFFRVFVPEGNYLAYGNLLWPEKMGGLLSINGADPVGYCRWMSPASFMIRSRKEQSASEADQSLQAIAAKEREEEKLREEAAAAAGTGKTGADDTASGTRAAKPSGLVGRIKALFGIASDAEEKIAEEKIAEETEVDEFELRKTDLAETAAAFDQKILSEKKKYKDFTGDVRTLVFSTEKGLAFKDYQFYGLNLDALAEASERIRSGEVDDVTIENGHVTCSVQGSEGRSLCLLVPWSKGWKALRNGEVVQPDTVAGTMITIPLVDGDNEIELTYEVPYLREGLYISAAAFAVMLFDALCRWISARKKRKAARQNG